MIGVSVTISLTLLCRFFFCEINAGVIFCLSVSFQYLHTAKLDIQKSVVKYTKHLPCNFQI
jgi:hypothetical protein